MTANKVKPPKLKLLKAGDLRAIAALAADGKLAPEEASRIIVGYIDADRVKASLNAIKSLRSYFEKRAHYLPIETAFRKKKDLPPFEFDRETATRSLDTLIWRDPAEVVPAPGAEPVALLTLLKEYKLRLEICLVSPRPPRKPKKPAEGGAK